MQSRCVSEEEAALTWLVSAKFAAAARPSITPELVFSILAEVDLYSHLEPAEQEEIHKYLELLREEIGMEQSIPIN